MIREQSELECPEDLTNFAILEMLVGWKYAYGLIMIDLLKHILKI